MVLLWLRDYWALTRCWFTDRDAQFNIRCDPDHSAEVAGLGDGDTKRQGVAAIMVSIAKRFELTLGMKEDDNLATLENPHNVRLMETH